MASITAIILSRNEEKYISDCIKSIKTIAERIVVVDSFSEDRTVEIAKELGAEVYQHEFYNYAKQYLYAVEVANVKTTWILRIDADERILPKAAVELETLCNEKYFITKCFLSEHFLSLLSCIAILSFRMVVPVCISTRNT